MAPSSCRGGVPVRAWDSGALGRSFTRSPPRGVTGSAPAPAPPAGALLGVPQAPPYSPRKRPVAKAAPSAAEARASAAGTESRGAGWIMMRPGGSEVRGHLAGAPGPALRPACPPVSALFRHCPRSCGLDRHLATAQRYCKPRWSEPAPSGGCTGNCARRRAQTLRVASGFFPARPSGLPSWVREEEWDGPSG